MRHSDRRWRQSGSQRRPEPGGGEPRRRSRRAGGLAELLPDGVIASVIPDRVRNPELAPASAPPLQRHAAADPCPFHRSATALQWSGTRVLPTGMQNRARACDRARRYRCRPPGRTSRSRMTRHSTGRFSGRQGPDTESRPHRSDRAARCRGHARRRGISASLLIMPAHLLSCCHVPGRRHSR